MVIADFSWIDLAAPIVRYSSSIGLGVKLRKMGIFICPSEVDNNDTLAALRVHEQEIALPNDDVANFTIPTLGQEQPSVMPIQSFKRQGLSKRKRVLNAHQQLKKKLFN